MSHQNSLWNCNEVMNTFIAQKIFKSVGVLMIGVLLGSDLLTEGHSISVASFSYATTIQ